MAFKQLKKPKTIKIMETIEFTHEQTTMLKKVLDPKAPPIPNYVSLTGLTGGILTTVSGVQRLGDGSIVVCGTQTIDSKNTVYPVIAVIPYDLTIGTVYNSFVNDPQGVLLGIPTGLCIISDSVFYMSYNVTNVNTRLTTPYLGIVSNGVISSIALPTFGPSYPARANAINMSVEEGIIVAGGYSDPSLNSIPAIWRVTYNSSNPLTPVVTYAPLKNASASPYGYAESISFVKGIGHAPDSILLGGYASPQSGSNNTPLIWTVIGLNTVNCVIAPKPNNTSYLNGKIMGASPNGQNFCGQVFDSVQNAIVGVYWNTDNDGDIYLHYSLPANAQGQSAAVINNTGTVFTNTSSEPWICDINKIPQPLTLLSYLTNHNGQHLPSSMFGYTVTSLSTDQIVLAGNGPQVAWMVINPIPLVTGKKEKSK
jgi:hypothetical protein